MDRIERIFTLHQILRARRTPVSILELQDRLECSPATAYRIIDYLRDVLGAPIVGGDRTGRFSYDKTSNNFELPGLWFTPAEIHALLVFQQLLHGLGNGLLDAELDPFRERIENLITGHAAGQGELAQRIRILGMAARPVGEHFPICANALVERRRLHIAYFGRARNTETRRDISPQRLTHYRNCWYLDAWCHDKKGLRSFAVERIDAVNVLDKPAKDIPDPDLNDHFASAYGIFSGTAEHTAVLRFTPDRARWVADERWHRDQEGMFLDDGSYELRIPYGDPTELLMDILKYGPDVEVMRPDALRKQVCRRLTATLEKY